jgi:hypothetical protein
MFLVECYIYFFFHYYVLNFKLWIIRVSYKFLKNPSSFWILLNSEWNFVSNRCEVCSNQKNLYFFGMRCSNILWCLYLNLLHIYIIKFSNVKECFELILSIVLFWHFFFCQLATKKKSIATHTKIFFEKKCSPKLPDFKDFFF